MSLLFLAVAAFLTGAIRAEAKGSSFVEVEKFPTWAEEYLKVMECPFELGEYGLVETVNPALGVKMKAEKGKGIIRLRWYKNGTSQGILQSSTTGFGGARWSRDGKFFTILNFTYAFDYNYDGDLYAFRYDGAKFTQVFVHKSCGEGAFSRGGQYLAYGSRREGLILLDLTKLTKKVIGFPEPSREGFVSSAIWDKEDHQLLVIYQLPPNTKYYILKLP